MKRQGPEFWRKHVRAWRESNLTQVAYCAAQRLNVKSFYRWRRRSDGVDAIVEQPPLTLVPARIATAAMKCITLRSPGGWTVELTESNIPSLADLLRSLP